jgi:hypothetical protein
MDTPSELQAVARDNGWSVDEYKMFTDRITWSAERQKQRLSFYHLLNGAPLHVLTSYSDPQNRGFRKVVKLSVREARALLEEVWGAEVKELPRGT